MSILTADLLADDYADVLSQEVVRPARVLLAIDLRSTALSLRRDSGGDRPSLLDLSGLGREIWAGVDATDYVRSLRDEWDSPR